MSNGPGLSAVSTAPPTSDAIEAAALAAALAENALESERKEHTVGPFEHTPQHLYGVCSNSPFQKIKIGANCNWGQLRIAFSNKNAAPHVLVNITRP
jgi:hypothetical protein